MGLNRRALTLLAPYIKNKKVLSLGYPDLLVPDVSMLGVEATKFSDTGKWHGCNFPLPETEHVFSLLGSTLDCVDINASRGRERVVDLNYPQDFPEYDIVLDAGTIEHCFNICQAVMNAANAVRVGGYIFHENPLSMVNHGFYNLCPTFYHDFYTQNGFKIKSASAWAKGSKVGVHPFSRFEAAPEATIMVLAERVEKLRLKLPKQTKYLLNPDLK